MNNIVIFSGTTEGRELSELLCAAKVRHVVCVATDYGREMMQENPYADVRVGRLDVAAMRELFVEDAFVVDATHPYATEVSANIKEAIGTLPIRYLRVSREEVDLPCTHMYEDITACAKALDQTQGNILLTTGSKELAAFMEAVSEETAKRTYVRVLPSSESIRLCEQAGIAPDHIIAMQGPFQKELNEAILKQYDIKNLVTKESGSAGGFTEKAQAAAAVSATLHVIARPAEDAGVSVSEAFRVITGSEVPTVATDCEAANPTHALQITLLGLGMGSTDCMTLAAQDALDHCDAVFGAKRLLTDLSCTKKYEMYRASEIIPVLEKETIQKAVIVFSGDTGFYSGAKAMLDALREWRKDLTVQVLPGISAISYLAAKLGESYDDACLFSLHGKSEAQNFSELADKVKHHAKVFTLLSGVGDIPKIAGLLKDSNPDVRIIAGQSLSYENESIRELSIDDALRYDESGQRDEAAQLSEAISSAPVTLLLKNPRPDRRLLIPVKQDSDFDREQIPMTKACIRHESIIRLGIREGDVFYDIGGGTGSVAIEAAFLHGSLRVTTIEKKPEAVDLIRRNVQNARLANVTVIEGNAEEVLCDLAKPDCVFIGGSSGKLSEIMEILHSKGDGIRFVITAVSMETIEEVRALITKYSPADEETIMLSVSDIQSAGAHHMLKAQNPVWIFAFTL